MAPKELSSKKGKKELVYYDDMFLFEMKDENSLEIDCLVKVTPEDITFYEKQNNDKNDGYYSFEIFINKDLSQMKISSVYKDENILKKDYSTCINDGIESIKETISIYDNNGILNMTQDRFEPIIISREDYIKDQIKNNDVINRLYKLLEDLMPEISDSLIDINPDFNYIVDSNINVYNKKKI